MPDLGLFYTRAIWGSTFILVKVSRAAVDPVTMVTYRFLIAAALLGGYLAATGKPLFINFQTVKFGKNEQLLRQNDDRLIQNPTT